MKERFAGRRAPAPRRAGRGSGGATPAVADNPLVPRPSSPLLTRERIVVTALAVIDAEGLPAFSLPRLARELGVRAPSLYHHVADKAEILGAVARAVLLEAPFPPRRSNAVWTEWFVEVSLGVRRTILRHAHAAPLLLEFTPREVLTPTYEIGAELLEEAGVPRSAHLLVLDGLDQLVLGSSVMEAIRPRERRERRLRDVVAEDTPLLARAVAGDARTSEQLFAETVRSFLRGAVADAPG